MKVKVLVDNNTLIDHYFLAEPGFSLYIETGGKKILFDTGYSDVFLKNANKMGVTFHDLDYVVLSHSHLDHTWGLDALIRFYSECAFEDIDYKRPKMLLHPAAFYSRTFTGKDEFGMMITRMRLEKYFDLIETKEAFWLTDQLVYLGEIERKFEFEAITPIGKVKVSDDLIDDYMIDDSALAYKGKNGVVVLTGCSHSGICNIVEQSRKTTKIEKVTDVLGGLHLQNPEKIQLDGTIEYFKHLSPEVLHACHCTDLKSKIALAKVANIEEIGSGMEIDY